MTKLPPEVPNGSTLKLLAGYFDRIVMHPYRSGRVSWGMLTLIAAKWQLVGGSVVGWAPAVRTRESPSASRLGMARLGLWVLCGSVP